MKVNTYLHFNGNCEEAMNYYADVLGGDITMMMPFKDAPEDICKQFPESVHELIMHATLEIGDRAIMASDFVSGKESFNKGNNFAVSINTDDEDEAIAIFNGLSEEGTVLMPLEPAFWGGKFGMLNDKFGVNWMLTLNDNSHA